VLLISVISCLVKLLIKLASSSPFVLLRKKKGGKIMRAAPRVASECREKYYHEIIYV